MTTTLPTICLNMIVKNESKIITRMLDSVYDIIDSYVICDTGSTDNTIELIHHYFQEKNIATKRHVFGMVIEEPFQDFGYNRTFALKACELLKQKADYILLMDADMKLRMNITPIQLKSRLTKNAYYFFQGSEGFFYKNVRIVKNHFKFTYWGTTHEYIKSPEGVEVGEIPLFDRNEIFIRDIGDGGSKTTKFERDIDLLQKGLESIPNNDRYTFYLANSFHDKGDLENAITTYKKRIEIGGWAEEVWYSHLAIARCQKRLENYSEFVNYLLLGYDSFPYRIENIYELVKYYRETSKHHLAYAFYLLADNVRKQNKHHNDFLFWQHDIYLWRLDYELSIIGYYVNPENFNLCELSMELIKKHVVEEYCYKNIIFNYKFYAPEIAKHGYTNEIKVPSEMLGDLVQSTPTICKLRGSHPLKTSDNGYILVGIRLINYHIDDNGNYVNQETIVSKTLLQVYEICQDNTFTSIQGNNLLSYDTTYDCRYQGPEDVRFFAYHDVNGKETVLYNANRGVDDHTMCIEKGSVDLHHYALKDSQLVYKSEHFSMGSNERQIEKNWVMFTRQKDAEDTIHWVYKFSPLEIGIISSSEPGAGEETNSSDSTPGVFQTIHITPSSQLPRFFEDLRGSTNGVNISNEIWFICHLVSYEDRRFYYHVMVVLDAETMNLKSYTPLWTFEKQKVEYTLGFVYIEEVNSFIIGYSILDKQTKMLEITKSWFDKQMIPHVDNV